MASEDVTCQTRVGCSVASNAPEKLVEDSAQNSEASSAE